MKQTADDNWGKYILEFGVRELSEFMIGYAMLKKELMFTMSDATLMIPEDMMLELSGASMADIEQISHRLSDETKIFMVFKEPIGMKAVMDEFNKYSQIR